MNFFPVKDAVALSSAVCHNVGMASSDAQWLASQARDAVEFLISSSSSVHFSGIPSDFTLGIDLREYRPAPTFVHGLRIGVHLIRVTPNGTPFPSASFLLSCTSPATLTCIVFSASNTACLSSSSPVSVVPNTLPPVGARGVALFVPEASAMWECLTCYMENAQLHSSFAQWQDPRGPKGLTPAARTKYMLDRSAHVYGMLQRAYEGRMRELLAEMQRAFVEGMLLGDDRALEFWGRSVRELGNCDELYEGEKGIVREVENVLVPQVGYLKDDEGLQGLGIVGALRRFAQEYAGERLKKCMEDIEDGDEDDELDNPPVVVENVATAGRGS